MSHDEYTKLFRYMTKRFDAIERVLDTKADKVDLHRLTETVDRLVKQQEVDRDERIAMTNQLNRHGTWIHQLATETKTRLSIEP